MKSVLALLLAAPLLADQTSPMPALQAEGAARLLHSPGWRDKAWGAYLAARLHNDDLNRLLADQFLPAAALRDAVYHSDEYAYLTVLFDAAIEAGIRVPAPRSSACAATRRGLSSGSPPTTFYSNGNRSPGSPPCSARSVSPIG